MTEEKRTAGVAVVGTELVMGRSTDANSDYLSRWLSGRGLEVRIVSKLPDDAQQIADEIRHMAGSLDVLVVTGGLGSTHDDMTREALARASKRPLELDEEMRRRIMRSMPVGADPGDFERQAYRPAGSRWLQPGPGSAPGMALEVSGKPVYALPGVPGEMEMMLDQVGDDLLVRFGTQAPYLFKVLRLEGISEPKAARALNEVIERYPSVNANILGKARQIDITLFGRDIDDAAVQIDQAADELSKEYGEYLFGCDDQTISEIVGGILADGELSISVAESITAGAIAADLASIPGSSRYLMGGITAYSNTSKEKLLNVSRQSLIEHGAVSEQVALEMAAGVRKAFNSNIGLAVTGIAGPTGGTSKKPVGLVYSALSSDAGREACEFRITGGRLEVQRTTIFKALGFLRSFLLKHAVNK